MCELYLFRVAMFQKYVDEHPCLRRGANLEAGSGGGNPSLVSWHMTNLLSLIHSQLLQHQFQEASATMATVVMAMDKVGEVTRKAGLECLLHGKDHHTALQFMKHLAQMFKKIPVLEEEMLVEIGLLIASSGNLQEAYDNLENHVTVSHRTSPLLQGYCGMMQFLLWKQETQHSSGEGSPSATANKPVKVEPDSVEMNTLEAVQPLLVGGRPQSAKALFHAKRALHHFRALKQVADVDTCMVDHFVCLHAELLIGLGREEEALKVLLSLVDQHPLRINPNRYVCSHLREHHANNIEKRVHHLKQLVQVDESCEEVLELTELLLQQEPLDYPLLFQMLLQFLDYPHNGGNERAWELLHHVQSQWPNYRHSDLWISRLQWWRKLYPERL